MPTPAHEILDAVRRLRVAATRDRRAPHKPLLLLVALEALQRGKQELGFEEVEERLGVLLDEYAPPVKGRHEPELPYWHLQSDGLWEIPGQEKLPRRAGKDRATRSALRATVGRFPGVVRDALLANPALVEQVVALLLEEHFPETLHDELLDAVGLSAVEPPVVLAAEPRFELTRRRRRDPGFRRELLRAYGHRCAVTGFHAGWDGSARSFGVDAAHVRWHSHRGPDDTSNGLALEKTMHLLFDRGAWTLTDDRRVLVSARFRGSEDATARLRALHGRRIRDPEHGSPVRADFIAWHREPHLGGIFRAPAL